MIGQFTLIEVIDKIGRGTIQTNLNKDVLILSSFVGPIKYFYKEEDDSWSVFDVVIEKENIEKHYTLKDLSKQQLLYYHEFCKRK